MLIILLFIMTVWAIVATFFVVRFATYVFAIENSLNDAIDVHHRTLVTFDGVLNTQLFLDSPQAREIFMEITKDIKLCKLATQRIADDFLRLSKNKYVLLNDTSSKEEKKEDE